MAGSARKHLLLPLLVVILGVAWLLNAMEFMPDVDWIWTFGLATVGILTLGVGGLSKFTCVMGPFFIIASVCSVLRQTSRLRLETEIPILIIVFGCLMLLVQIVKVPLFRAAKPEDKS